MKSTKENILRTLAYFDLFQYPLTLEEIRSFHSSAGDELLIPDAVNELLLDKRIYAIDEFYSLQADKTLAERRRNGNEKAAKEMKKAARSAAILSKFPYVSSLSISGSLSKNFADEQTDIDFFIITTKNRLWIARTLMHVFYKFVRLVNKERYFCMNYYVDEAAMEIPEKNVFTAMELLTLVPVKGVSSFSRFMIANAWAKEYFPLHSVSSENASEIKRGIFRRAFEKMFNGRMGNALEKWLLKKMQRHWQKKLNKPRYNKKGISMGMLAGEHFAKPDPRHFQEKLIERYRNKLKPLLYPEKEMVVV